jgi:hypothetical protein
MRVRRLLGVVSLGTMFATAAMWAGCGGATTNDIDGGGGSAGSSGSRGTAGTAGSGGSAGSGGTTGTGGAAGSAGSGGSAGSSPDGGTPESGTKDGGTTTPCTGKDCCGAAPCGSGLVCCANVGATDAAAALQCLSSCAADDTLACTHETDCSSSSEVCCITAVFKAGTGIPPTCLEKDVLSASSVCSATCDQNITESCAAATDTIQLCTTPSDCTNTMYPDCCTVTLAGQSYSACLPSIVKSLDPSICM